MRSSKTRRDFLVTGGAVACAIGATGSNATAAKLGSRVAAGSGEPLFKISLAQWSLHRELNDGKMTNLDFPKVAKETFGIEAIEYVNQFFMDKANDLRYLMELKTRCEDSGVTSLLIMCDGEGQLGDPDSAARKQAVENHHKWVVAAKYLGCHSIRVNAASGGTWEEQAKLAAEGLAQLSGFAKEYGLNVIVENHGGLSSNGKWLAQVIKSVGMDNCGSLPDFGNFRIGEGADGKDEWYDRYQGVAELMPFAKAVSAKSHDFDENGNEKNTDFKKMMEIVLKAGYRGYVGVEYEGNGLSEKDGILATKKLLMRTREAVKSAP